ncbi:MAG: transcription antitermination factor NusB [Candidatus Sumerlaeia bacterium]|nr:transcription antitermination factor NusB [Candidatus Sumerlaeia bacterium]
MATRRQARENAFHVVFSQLFTGYGLDLALQRADQLAEDQRPELDDLARRLLGHVENHRARIEECVSGFLKGWTLERLAPTEGALLRLGVAELLFERDIPPASTINEYVELAKRYGDEKAPGFVNAVLDNVRKAHRADR